MAQKFRFLLAFAEGCENKKAIARYLQWPYNSENIFFLDDYFWRK